MKQNDALHGDVTTHWRDNPDFRARAAAPGGASVRERLAAGGADGDDMASAALDRCHRLHPSAARFQKYYLAFQHYVSTATSPTARLELLGLFLVSYQTLAPLCQRFAHLCLRVSLRHWK